MTMKQVRARSTVSAALIVALIGLVDTALARQHRARDDEAPALIFSRVPDKARSKPNPFENDVEAVRAGNKLFEQHCAECHGKAGNGSDRGPALNVTAVERATPGQIFWVLTNGIVRRGMPAWSKLPEPQRWQIVAFLHRLSEKSGEAGQFGYHVK